MANFKSTILLHPGLYNSGETHWQTHWENAFGFERILQDDWETPSCDDWTARLDEYVMRHDPSNVILVGHSLACATTAFWAKKYGRKIKAAMLVALSDTEGPIYPPGTTGFTPMPDWKLPFPSIAISSNNDEYVSTTRAKEFAADWGSELIILPDQGHIGSAANLGMWEFGLDILRKLDQ